MNRKVIVGKRFERGFLVLAFSLAAGVSRAQSMDHQPDETLPGFSSGNVFHSSGVDNVNVFSGDTGIVIPLSPVYTLSPGYTWQLKAYNTAKFWHFDTDEACKDESNNPTNHAMIHGSRR